MVCGEEFVVTPEGDRPAGKEGRIVRSEIVIARNVPWNTRSVPWIRRNVSRIPRNGDTDTTLEPGDTRNEVWIPPKRLAIPRLEAAIQPKESSDTILGGAIWRNESADRRNERADVRKTGAMS
jgi:hypothetical protein